MSQPFDASPKALLQYGPEDWPPFVGVKAQSVEIVDADISTVTGATDKVLRLHAAEGDRIQHFDFQSGPDAAVPRRAHRYNALLEDRHDLPVESIVILLARKANLRTINGLYERKLHGVRAMKESVTYQTILEEGVQKGEQKWKVQEARQLLIRIGADRFGGLPTPEQLQELEAIANVSHLEDLAVRVAHVGSWSELLTSPEKPRPKRRKKS